MKKSIKYLVITIIALIGTITAYAFVIGIKVDAELLSEKTLTGQAQIASSIKTSDGGYVAVGAEMVEGGVLLQLHIL